MVDICYDDRTKTDITNKPVVEAKMAVCHSVASTLQWKWTLFFSKWTEQTFLKSTATPWHMPLISNDIWSAWKSDVSDRSR